MKVAIDCQSILLQKTLENFLKKYIVSKKQAQVVIKDYKDKEEKSFYIAQDPQANLQKPFSKSQLILALKEYLAKETTTVSKQEKSKQITFDSQKDFSLLEKRIHMLTREYEQKIIETIKAFYG